MNDQTNVATSINTHVQWLADWREAVKVSPDDTIEEKTQLEAAQSLSVLLATTPAISQGSMIAQIEWFKEDLGGYVPGNASPAHDLIFDTLIKNAEHMGV